MTIPTQQSLREREMNLVETTVADPRVRYMPSDARQAAIFDAIAKDRAERWAAFLPDVQVPDALVQWAADMELVHGPLVQVRRNVLPWLTALMVVRYGEAEYYWPEAFSDDDVNRAMNWQHRGDVPDQVSYIVAEDQA